MRAVKKYLVKIMIISEKQIIQLMQFSQAYVNILDTLNNYEDAILSSSGLQNRIHAANLLSQIAEQQSDELKTIE